MRNLKIPASVTPSRPASWEWAPLLVQPMPGSHERLIVGAVAKDADGVLVLKANKTARLECLYGVEASTLLLAIDAAIADLRDQEAAIRDGELKFSVSGFQLGDWTSAEGTSVEETTERWLAAVSSLHDYSHQRALVAAQAAVSARAPRAASLRLNVFTLVQEQNQEVAYQFSDAIQKGRVRRRRAAKPIIDFSGKRLIANIEDVSHQTPGKMADLMKRRLWDLNVVRDRAVDMHDDVFEMLICRIPDPQADRDNAVIEMLTQQADEHKLRLREFSNARQISEHIVRTEAA